MSKLFSLQGFVNADPGHAIEAQISKLRGKPGCRVLGVVELERHSVLKPDSADAEPTVNLRISDLELAKGTDQEDLLRETMQALHLHRTAAGTLTEAGDVQLAQDTLDKLPDLVSTFESARCRAALEHLVGEVRGLAANNRHNDGDLRRKLKELVAKGEAALAGEQLSIDGAGKLDRKTAPLPATKKPATDPFAAVKDIPDSEAPTTGGPA